MYIICYKWQIASYYRTVEDNIRLQLQMFFFEIFNDYFDTCLDATAKVLSLYCVAFYSPISCLLCWKHLVLCTVCGLSLFRGVNVAVLCARLKKQLTSYSVNSYTLHCKKIFIAVENMVNACAWNEKRIGYPRMVHGEYTVTHDVASP